MYIFIYIYDFFEILKSRLFKYFIVIYYYYLRKEMVLDLAKTYINTMTIDIIRNKNKNIIHFLLSAMIFVLISKSYFYFIYVVNLKSNIPANLNFLFVWSFRILLLSLVLFIRWNLYDILLYNWIGNFYVYW